MKQGSSMEVAKVTKRRYQSVHYYYASMLYVDNILSFVISVYYLRRLVSYLLGIKTI